MSNATRRVAATLGVERIAKDITPNPLNYACEYNRRKAEEAEEMFE